MIDFITRIFSRSLNQILLLFGGVFVLAFMLCFVSSKIRETGVSVMGSDYYYLVAPGVVCHETGHALGCLITGTEIVRYAPFRPHDDTLGYVRFRRHRNVFLRHLTEFVIASGPVWFGCLVVLLISKLFTKDVRVQNWDEVFPSVPFPSSFEYCTGVVKAGLRMMGNMLKFWKWKSLANIICLYILLCVVSEMTLSVSDLEGLTWGAVYLAALFLFLNVIPFISRFMTILMYRLSRKLFVVHVLMFFVLIIDVILYLVIAIPVNLLK